MLDSPGLLFKVGNINVLNFEQQILLTINVQEKKVQCLNCFRWNNSGIFL